LGGWGGSRVEDDGWATSIKAATNKSFNKSAIVTSAIVVVHSYRTYSTPQYH
jgi:hypothetical protein